MSERLFTPDEVDALIPRLAEMVGRAMDHHQQALALQQHLHEEQERIRASGGEPHRPARLEGAGRSGWTGSPSRCARPSQEIAALGGTTKDLETGLVDFPRPRRRARRSNLCWKHGETAVRFWHGFDEGYAQRKPLP